MRQGRVSCHHLYSNIYNRDNTNNNIYILNVPFWVEECGMPHFKFGIYRPGNEISKNSHSIVDFDKIILTKIKKGSNKK